MGRWCSGSLYECCRPVLFLRVAFRFRSAASSKLGTLFRWRNLCYSFRLAGRAVRERSVEILYVTVLCKLFSCVFVCVCVGRLVGRAYTVFLYE